MLQRDLGVKAVLIWVLNMFHFIPDYNFFFFFFFGPDAGSAACPILLLTFETSVRLIWLKKTPLFKSVKGANLNSATQLCAVALCLWVRGLILKLLAPECNISCSCRQFQTQKPLPNKYALPMMHKIFIMLLRDQLYPRWHGVYESHNIILYNDIILLEVDVLLLLQCHSHLHGSAASSAETFC